MTEKIITSVFNVESEAYQALSEIRRDAVNDRYIVSQIALVKNENGRIVTKEWFDTGVESRNDASMGGMIGSLVGIIGGPIGMLLGGSMGYLAGSAKDADDVEDNVSMIERVSNQIVDGETALISLVQEVTEGSYESRLGQWQTSVVVEDAAEVAAEIEKAENLQREMERNARKQMREEKVQAGKEKLEETRNKIKAQFEELINKRK